MLALFCVLALALLGGAHADFTKTVKQKGDCSAGIVAYVRWRADVGAWPSIDPDHTPSPYPFTFERLNRTLFSPTHSLTPVLDVIIATRAFHLQGDRPHIHYKGFLEDGTEFDSSYARHTPISFPAGHEFVIKCWDDAVIGMCVGEEIRLICPPEIAYGDRGAGDVIPPGATLTFDMKLVKIGETNPDN